MDYIKNCIKQYKDKKIKEQKAENDLIMSIDETSARIQKMQDSILADRVDSPADRRKRWRAESDSFKKFDDDLINKISLFEKKRDEDKKMLLISVTQFLARNYKFNSEEAVALVLKIDNDSEANHSEAVAL
jgi:DNA-binding transcriptional regulator GbsR (MarR family)